MNDPTQPGAADALPTDRPEKLTIIPGQPKPTKPIADFASRKLLAGPVLGVVLTVSNQLPPWGLVCIIAVYIIMQGAVDLAKELRP